MRHWSRCFDKSKDETAIHGGDTVNDLSYYDPETENLNTLFGNGRSGTMPTHNCTSIIGNPAIGIVSPITGAAMTMTGSFGGLLGQ